MMNQIVTALATNSVSSHGPDKFSAV